MAFLRVCLLIILSLELCSSIFIACPQLTQCLKLPAGCVCGPKCGMNAIEINCGKANFGAILPGDAFINVQTMGDDFPIYLQLPSNLADINIDAFKGIETRITSLKIQNSNLVRVPAALSKLHNLQVLDLSSNQIQTLSDSDFKGFANTLQLLTISLTHMSAYPKVIDSLPALRVLTLNDISFQLNNMSVFHGNSVISTLKMTFSTDYNGPVLPPSIVNLSGLRSLYVHGRKIPCDCSLKYLQQWDVSNVRIHSQCTSGDYHVLEYIKGDLQRC